MPYSQPTYKVIQDLVSYNADHLEALLACDRVDDHVAMNSNKMLAIQDRVFILTGCIDDFHGVVLIPVPNDLAECVLNGRVVGVDEVAFHVLDCERALACCE